MYVCQYISVYACVRGTFIDPVRCVSCSVFACMIVCVYVCMHICMHTCMYISMYA